MSKLKPVLSAHWDQEDSFTIEAYRRNGGYKALAKALSMDADAVINAVKDSGLRGRGGALRRPWRCALDAAGGTGRLGRRARGPGLRGRMPPALAGPLGHVQRFVGAADELRRHLHLTLDMFRAVALQQRH